MSRLLLLDHELFYPEAHADLMAMLAESGYDVEYRQYYPSLAMDDPGRYQTIIILGGSTPELSASQMSRGDVEVADRFVQHGGVLVLGAAAGENERYTFNLILHTLRVNIRIGADWIQDPEHSAIGTLRHYPYYAPIRNHPIGEGIDNIVPGGLCRPLRVGNGVLTLLSSLETAHLVGGSAAVDLSAGRPAEGDVYSPPFPVAALAKVRTGSVLVTSRYLLDLGGMSWRVTWRPLLDPSQIDGTKRFFINCCRYIEGIRKEETSWNVEEPSKRSQFSRPKVPKFPINTAPPERDLPSHVRIFRLGRGGALVDEHAGGWRKAVRSDLFGWIEKENVRAGWGSIDQSDEHIDLLIERLKAAGINLLWGYGWPEAMVEERGAGVFRDRDVGIFAKAELVRRWDRVHRRIEGSQIRWFMGTHYPGLCSDYRGYTRSVGCQGQPSNAPSPLDVKFWQDHVIRPAQIVAEYSLQRPALVGLMCDLEMYSVVPSWYFTNGDGFDDYSFRKFVTHAEGYLSSRELETVRNLPFLERFEGLKREGILDRYYWFLESEAEKIGRLYREEVDAVNPQMIYGFYAQDMVPTWFYWGFWRGVSTQEKPCIFLTFQMFLKRFADTLARRGIYGYYAVASLLGNIPAGEHPVVFERFSTLDDGYWLNRITWLVEPAGAESIEAPERLGLSKEEIVALIAAANQHLDSKRVE